jgi:uncharacterized DUF497 family protein
MSAMRWATSTSAEHRERRKNRLSLETDSIRRAEQALLKPLQRLEFEWDERKSNQVFEEPGFGFAAQAFLDPQAAHQPDSRSYNGEVRFRLYGHAQGRLLIVDYTKREVQGPTRFTSARASSAAGAAAAHPPRPRTCASCRSGWHVLDLPNLFIMRRCVRLTRWLCNPSP